MTRRLAFVPLLLALRCAHGQQPPTSTPEAPPRPMVLLPRSSIAAVIAHRGDLALSDDQVERLQARDNELEKAQATLRSAFDRKQAGVSSHPAQQPGMGMGGGGGRHRNQPRSAAPTTPAPTLKNLEEQMDDNDTRAYLAAEAAVLSEKQRDPARDVAEKYREDLYEQRDQAERQSKER
jgi:hypothetical protein